MNRLGLIKNNIIWIVFGSAFFYIVFILYSDASEISDNFLNVRIELVFPVFLLILISHMIKSIRQKEFLCLLGEKISFKHNLIIYMAGMSMISTPGGVGMFIKSHFLKKKFQIKTNKSFSVIFLERFHDLLAVTCIVIFSLIAAFSLISTTLVIISCILLIGIYLSITNLNIFSFILRKLSTIEFLRKKISGIGPNESFAILTQPKAMTKGWITSISGWSLDSLAVYVGFLAFNVDLGYLLTSQIYFTSLGYGVLSLMPGGIGVTEGIADYLLVQQGLNLSVASSLVVFTRLATMWFATIIGVIFTRFALKQKIDIS
ncbi:MAG: flippase-like domain-containing protein [Nitrosopumilus sp.]|nr:flippase-like domain-containing protein [Nitrosopumilus sp.]MDH3384449.1 flippase-like domain-containing protein [Nitrosopumilus sp.]